MHHARWYVWPVQPSPGVPSGGWAGRGASWRGRTSAVLTGLFSKDKKHLILLREQSRLTVLWYFEVDSKGTHPYTYMYPLSWWGSFSVDFKIPQVALGCATPCLWPPALLGFLSNQGLMCIQGVNAGSEEEPGLFPPAPQSRSRCPDKPCLQDHIKPCFLWSSLAGCYLSLQSCSSPSCLLWWLFL